MGNSATKKPVVLCILDGWGKRIEKKDNAIANARTPFWDEVTRDYPNMELDTSGRAVGLPEGQMGNSEVGHMTIGSGRIILQDLPRIDDAIDNGELVNNPEFKQFVADLQKAGGVCHLIGLMSPGGVHAHQDHILALAKALAAERISVKIHAILDGRDTPPQSAKEYLQAFESQLVDDPVLLHRVMIATVSGRYFAMDRDNRWERVEKAYRMIIEANGPREIAYDELLNRHYQEGKSDEFLTPCMIGEYKGARDGDGFIMANFRSDRARELLITFLDPNFTAFHRNREIKWGAKLGMVEYSAELSKYMPAMFPPQSLSGLLGEVVANAGKKQLRIAETEKYAHVTFFFNGGREELFEGEERILIPSPKVATYDLKPEMSAYELRDALVSALKRDQFDLVICNFANPDMVGHTGIMKAAVKAVETVDECMQSIADCVLSRDGTLLITADHGNVEQMVDPITHQPHTSHTLNPVPLVVVSNDKDQLQLAEQGGLSDLAPTICELLEIPLPKEMTGQVLVTRKQTV